MSDPAVPIPDDYVPYSTDQVALRAAGRRALLDGDLPTEEQSTAIATFRAFQTAAREAVSGGPRLVVGGLDLTPLPPTTDPNPGQPAFELLEPPIGEDEKPATTGSGLLDDMRARFEKVRLDLVHAEQAHRESRVEHRRIVEAYELRVATVTGELAEANARAAELELQLTRVAQGTITYHALTRPPGDPASPWALADQVQLDRIRLRELFVEAQEHERAQRRRAALRRLSRKATR